MKPDRASCPYRGAIHTALLSDRCLAAFKKAIMPNPTLGDIRPIEPCSHCGAPRTERYNGIEWEVQFPKHDGGNPFDCIDHLKVCIDLLKPNSFARSVEDQSHGRVDEFVPPERTS